MADSESTPPPGKMTWQAPAHAPVYGVTPGAPVPDFQGPWVPAVPPPPAPAPPPMVAPAPAYVPVQPYPMPMAWGAPAPAPMPWPVPPVDLGPQVFGPAVTPEERYEMLRPYISSPAGDHDHGNR